MQRGNHKSNHILNTSTNLLGFCLVVLTSLKVSRYNELTRIDECTGVACIFLVTSCVLSFLSIRTNNDKLEKAYEIYADRFFLIALAIIFIITFLIAFSVFI